MGIQNKQNNLAFWVPVKKNKIHTADSKIQTPSTFQKSLKTTLLIGQAFSLIPVVGVFGNDANNVKFIMTSWKCFYSLISLFGQFVIVVMALIRVFSIEATLSSTSPVIFYGMTCSTMIMFFRVASAWPELVQYVAKTEELYPKYDNKLTRKCQMTCVIVLFLSITEYVLFLLSALSDAIKCFPNKNMYEGFVRNLYPWVFNYLPYSSLLGMLIQFLHSQAIFIWNFCDLFVICMSYYLTSRLEHVNKKLAAAQGKYLPEIFWKSTREEYCRATQVVRKVDEVISGIVFVSFANNLFFICLQLFNVLEDGIKGNGECNGRSKETTPLSGFEAASYFLFSLVYLILRSVAVSLIASQVNTASLAPAPILYDVPSPVYCVEVQRFLDQVNGDKVALSGLQFFSVTRGLLLTVAGTIVTYELVMFQFNSPTLDTNNTTLIYLNISATVTP